MTEINNFQEQLLIFSKVPSRSLLSKLIIDIKNEYDIVLKIPNDASVSEIVNLINYKLVGAKKHGDCGDKIAKKEQFKLDASELEGLSHELFEYFIENGIIKEDKVVITSAEMIDKQNKEPETESSESESDSSSSSESESGEDDLEGSGSEKDSEDSDSENEDSESEGETGEDAENKEEKENSGSEADADEDFSGSEDADSGSEYSE